MSLLKRTATGFAWNHFGRIGEYLLLYVFSVIIARNLGPEVNGVYALLLSVVQMLLVVSSLGLETSIMVSYPALLREHAKDALADLLRKVLWIRLGILAGVCLLFYLLRDLVIRLLNAPPLFVDIVSIFILYFALRSIVSLLTTIFLARLETKTVNIVGIIIRCIEVLSAAILVSLGFGLKEVVLLILITTSLQVFVLLWLLRDHLSSTARSEQISVGPIISQGWKFWFNGLLEFLLGRQADVILLSFFLISPVIIGYYDVSLGFALLINMGLFTGMYGVSMVSFASILESGEERLGRYWNFLARMVVMVVVPVFVFAIAYAEAVIPLVYSPQYRSSAGLFQVFGVLLVATRFLGGGVAADYFYASGKTEVLLRASAISGAVNVILAVLLIPRYQALGAVFATGVAALVIAGMHAYYAGRFLNVQLPWKTGLQILAVSGLSIVAVIFLTGDVLTGNVYVSLLLYTIVFVALCYIVKPLSTEDSEFIRTMNGRAYAMVKAFVSSERGEAGVDRVRDLTDRQKWAYSWMPRSGIVVDVGSSYSSLCAVLSQKSVYAFAVDVDEPALRRLRDEGVSVVPVVASAMHLPFPSGSVDTVLLLDVLEHVKDEKKTIEEVQRVLRPGGKLLLSVPNKGLFSFLDPQNLRARLDGKLSAETLHRHYSDADLTRLLFLRFRILQQHYGGLFLYPLTFAGNNFVRKHWQRDWSRFFTKLGDIDNDISWGRWSYNMIVLAEKI